jgi:hypothetical protein
VTSAADRASGHSQQFERNANHHKDDSDRPEDWNTGDKSNDEQNDSENYHVATSTTSRLVSLNTFEHTDRYQWAPIGSVQEEKGTEREASVFSQERSEVEAVVLNEAAELGILLLPHEDWSARSAWPQRSAFL